MELAKGPLNGTSQLVNKRGQNKCVTFSSKLDIKTIQGLDELSKQCIEPTWYNGEEYFSMRKDALRIVHTHRKSLDLDAEESIRGLERLTSMGSFDLQQKWREDVIASVLNEQDCQRMLGKSDPLALSFASSVYSKSARGHARLLGLQDDADVRPTFEKSGHAVDPKVRSRLSGQQPPPKRKRCQ